ncbi:MAG: type I 3-dehydroquinate dehydratase [Acidobacteria bacterium]|nr:type I 3-dehydroquinate dehydratase [Acidobacteriota bacterium]
MKRYVLTVEHPDQIPANPVEQAGFELRLDRMTPDQALMCLQRAGGQNCLATYRSIPHFGHADPSTRASIGWPLRLNLAQQGCAAIDIEWDEPELKQKIQAIQALGKKVVLSNHSRTQTTLPIDAPILGLLGKTDCLKWIVTGENTAFFQNQRQAYAERWPCQMVYFAMGGDFWASRILSLLYGAPFTFVRADDQPALAPGLMSLSQIQSLDLPNIGFEEVQLFAVIGLPIGHSRSPFWHTPRLRESNPDSLLLPLPCASAADWELLQHSFPELRGSAITKPMKEIVARYLSDTHPLGAVNTWIKQKSQEFAANTDFEAIKSLLTPFKSHATVRILGFGGLGKAAAQAALDMGFRVQVCNRTRPNINLIDSRLELVDWQNRHSPGAEILIQCTSVGMEPEPESSPLDEIPSDCLVFFETIYHPLETRILQQAQRSGIQTISGTDLFEAQAAIQNDWFKNALAN